MLTPTIAALEDVRMCNCADCGCTLLGIQQPDSVQPLLADLEARTPYVAGRIKGRPYCERCLSTEHSSLGGCWRRIDGEMQPL